MSKSLKYLIGLISFTCISVPIFSQKGKYGATAEDSIECVKSLSLYRDHIRNKDNTLAYEYWRFPFDKCPQSSKNLYIDGAKIFRELLDNNKDEAKKVELCDSLMLIYDRRIQYFGEKGKVRGFQGSDLLKYRRNDGSQYVQQGYNYLKEALALKEEEPSKAILPTLLSASLTLYKAGIIDDNQVIEDYILVSDLIDKMIAGKPSDQLIELKQSMDVNFSNEGPSDCSKLTSYFSAQMAQKQSDSGFLKSTINVLYAKKCTSSDLYFNALSKLFLLEPSADLALKVASWAKENNKHNEAVNYLNQAIQLETTNDKKADYYLTMAVSYQKLGEKSKSREACNNAISIRSTFGEPYIVIGQLYTESKNECTNSSDNKNLPGAVFWLAVDMFVKAKTVDPKLEETANKLIAAYSQYFPNKEDAFFKGVNEGASYTVGCWINTTTKARF